MTADAATLVWLAPGTSTGGSADAGEERALGAWARAHGVTLERPSELRVPWIAADPAVAERVEQLLERARDGLAARDAAGADAALDAAGSLLRAHPELPQAAWLMAEVERGGSMRWRRLAPADSEAAERAWSRADAMDGGRVAAVSEQASTQAAAPALVTLEVPADEGALWDGAPVAGASVRTHAGSHALVVTWDGGPIGAAWVDVPAGSTIVRPAAPAAPTCTGTDLGRARLEGERVVAAGVRCARWVAATSAPTGSGVRVATCERERCGALLDWSPSPPWAQPLPERAPAAWPSWATWTLVGAGLAAAGAGVAAAVVTTQPGPSETRFVTGGLKSR